MLQRILFQFFFVFYLLSGNGCVFGGRKSVKWVLLLSEKGSILK